MLLWKWEKAGGDSKAAAVVFTSERRIAPRNQSETLVKSSDQQMLLMTSSLSFTGNVSMLGFNGTVDMLTLQTVVSELAS